MKSVLPLLALVTLSLTLAAAAGPALACAQHQSHAALKTAEQIPPEPPKVVIEPAAQSVPAPASEAVNGTSAMSKPAWSLGGGCDRSRKTVYLTQ